MNLSETVTLSEHQQLIDRIQVVRNILGIPMIEIEQLNPRVRELQGVMKCKYHALGGVSAFSNSGTQEYEWNWAGGDITFVRNPYPRAPVGTGNVAFIDDDYLAGDNGSLALPTPEGSKSGELTGYNRELLATHYDSGYWKIIDTEIDADIQRRFWNIIFNTKVQGGISEAEAKKIADESLDKAIAIQNKGASGMNIRVKFTGSSIAVKRPTASVDPTSIENNPAFLEMKRQNAEMRELLERALGGKTEKNEKPAEPPKKRGGRKPGSKNKPKPGPLGVSGNLGEE